MKENLACSRQDLTSLAALTSGRGDAGRKKPLKVKPVKFQSHSKRHHKNLKKRIRFPSEVAENDADVRRHSDIESFLSTIIKHPPVSEFEIDLAFENAKLRALYLSEQKFVSLEMESRDLKVSKAKLLEWYNQGRIFGVNNGEQILFPAFQFRKGEPIPIIEKVLSELPKEMHSWQVALWFDSSNGWLDSELPQNCLERESESLRAAKQEALASCF